MKGKVIVTGGAGYIGSHTVVELLEQGYEVVIIDNLSNSRIEVLEGIKAITKKSVTFVNIDLQDRDALMEVCNVHRDAIGVIHFAAFKSVNESVDEPLKYYKNNVNGLVHLLEAMQLFEIDTLVYSSSCTVYGQPKELPVTENAPIMKAASPYGATKIIGEQIIKDLCDGPNNFNAISLRYFNPIGAHTSGKIGELPLGTPNNLMPYITQTAAGIRSELKIFGNDYKTKDGTAIRDYIHVVDLAQAHISALSRLSEEYQGPSFDMFNLGTGRGHSVLEVLAAFQQNTGLEVPFKFAPRRKGDVEAVFASTEKATKLLGWKATRDIDDMTASAWNWEKTYRKIN